MNVLNAFIVNFILNVTMTSLHNLMLMYILRKSMCVCVCVWGDEIEMLRVVGFSWLVNYKVLGWSGGSHSHLLAHYVGCYVCVDVAAACTSIYIYVCMCI